MKPLYLLSALSCILVSILGCDTGLSAVEEDAQQPIARSAAVVQGPAEARGLVEETVPVHNKAVPYELVAGKTLDAGSVHIWNRQNRIYFCIESEYTIRELHLAVGDAVTDIPMTGSGNPVPGRFPYMLEPDSLHVCFSVPYSYEPEQKVYIALHAESDRESVWASSGEKLQFSGKTWATYLAFQIKCRRGDEEHGGGCGECGDEDSHDEHDDHDDCGHDQVIM